MVVTKIEPITKTRFRIYADENEKPLFVLYKGELSRYHIAVGEEISGDVYEEIYRNVIVKRAKARALHLLNDMGRTEAQLRRKLTTGGYTEEAAEEAIAYVKSFGYLNDWEYARSFIEGRKNRKSRRELGAALCQKGIGREEAERALEEFYDTEDSEAAVRELLRKKKFDLKTADYVQTQKMAGYLLRKGFGYDEIRRALKMSEQ